MQVAHLGRVVCGLVKRQFGQLAVGDGDVEAVTEDFDVFVGQLLGLVQDCWHENYAGAPTDDRAWTTGCSGSSQVLRGGSWFDFPAYLRSAIRLRGTPVNRFISYGFRLARTLLTP